MRITNALLSLGATQTQEYETVALAQTAWRAGYGRYETCLYQPDDLDLSGIDAALEAASDLPPVPVPAQLTRRQFAKQMRVAGMITGAESVAMIATAQPPAMIEALFAQLPSDAEIAAREDFAAQTYLRSDHTMVALLTAAGVSSGEADAFFIAAAAL